MADPQLPQFRIGMVSRLTGLTIHQIRVWEKRYGTVEPTRSEGGDRLYSEEDVLRLSLLKQLSDFGHSIGSTAKLPHDQLERMLDLHENRGSAPSAGPRQGRTQRSRPPANVADVAAPFLEAIGRLDVLQAERLLARAAGNSDPAEFVSQVLLPMLQRVGALWAEGEFSVAHEHAASAVLRTQLGALMRTFIADDDAPAAVCTTPAGELHEFGALSAALYAASHGWRVVYLGPNLPAKEIAQAATVAGARLVLISVVCPRQEIEEELRSLVEALTAEAVLVVGGEGAALLRGLPPRVRRVHALTDLAPFL